MKLENFSWEIYQSELPSKLSINKKIKKVKGDKSKVFCGMPYSQLLYDMYNGIENKIYDSEIKVGDVINGTITAINKNSAIVDINWIEDAIIDLSKEDSNFLKYIQIGFPIEIIIEKIPDNKKNKNIYASFSKNVIDKKKKELLESIGQPSAYLAKIKELIYGGYFVDIDGVECFMPGSLGGINKLLNFEELVGKSMYVTVINFSKEKNYLVVSHREYLKTLVPEEISKLKINEQYEGFIIGTSKHGLFVEFNKCLTGLITRDDIIPENVDDFDNGKFKLGDKINFFVKEILDNDKISLSQKPIKQEIDSWIDVEKRYKVPSVVTGTIKKLVNFGAFIEIEPKIVGLLHKSQLSKDMELEVGQEISVKITKIDRKGKKLNFAI